MYSLRTLNVVGVLEAFTPSRGLRKGETLSPFLFLFIADALSVLVHKSSTMNILEGLKICRNAPLISHFLFVDDSLLFFQDFV